MAYLGHKPAVGENNSFRILDDISSFVVTFDGSSASAVGLSDETITITENNHRFITGQRVTYSNGGGGNITGLVNGQAYFIINHSKTQIKLASSASNALAGTAINLTGLGTGSSHTLTLAFDGVNTKFDPTFGNGMHDTLIKRAAQLVISINGVIQQPHDTATPSTGFGVDSLGHIIFSTAPISTDIFWGHILASNTVTFDSSDNDVDTFTGDGSTTSFTLSKIPPDNRNILVTIDGVVQYPSDAANTRSYNVSENVMTFVAAPGLGTVIQVRHIGYAGIGAGGGGGVTGFYGRTGNVSLVSTDNIVANNATFNGNVSIAQTLTYEDVTDIDAVGLITARSGIKDQTLTAGRVVYVDSDKTLTDSSKLTFGNSGVLNLMGASGNTQLALFRTNTNTTGTAGIVGFYASDNHVIASMYALGDGDNEGAHLVFNTTSAASGTSPYSDVDERLRITSGGTVNIGGDYGNTSGKLKVSGNIHLASGDLTFLNNGHKIANSSSGGNVSIQGGATYAGGRIVLSGGYGSGGGTADIRFYADTTTTPVERARITSDGQIGIGTVPVSGDQQNLTIHGDTNYVPGIRFKQAGVNKYRIMIEGGTGHTYHDAYADGGDIVFRTNAAAGADEKFRITEEGNVGIGTNNPAKKLEVFDTTQGVIRIRGGGAGSDTSRKADLSLFASGAREYVVRADASDAAFKIVDVSGSNAERFVINSSGDVGIGVDPGSGVKLHIKDTSSDGAIKLEGTGSTLGSWIQLQNNDGTANSYSSIYGADAGGQAVNEIRFTNANNANNEGFLSLYTRPSGGSIIERLRIKSDGSVNIGNPDGYAIWNALSSDVKVQFELRHTVGVPAGMALLEERGDSNGTNLILGKSRYGNGVGVINSGDTLGSIKFSGADGTRQHNGAAIVSWTSGTIATGRVPANLSFYTAPDSVSAYVERLRIKSDGGILQLKTGGNVNLTLSRNESVGTTNQVLGVIDFASNTAHTVQARLMAKSLGTTNVGGDLIVETRANGGSLDERIRIKGSGEIETGNKTITGGTNLAIQSFKVKGIWSGSPSIGKEIEMVSGYDSAVKMAAIGYNLTDVNLGGSYGGDLVFHTQPLYSSPTTPIPESMRINSRGHVTKTRHVMFSARGEGANWEYFDSGDGWYSLGDTAVSGTSYYLDNDFRTNHLGGINRGTDASGNSCWENDKARFTAPVAGMYHFEISLYLSAVNGGGTVHIQPWIGSSDTSLYTYNGSSISSGGSSEYISYPNADRSINVYLTKGQVFQWSIYAQGTNKIRIYKSYSHISGYLVG